jgi:hypothetical protein
MIFVRYLAARTDCRLGGIGRETGGHRVLGHDCEVWHITWTNATKMRRELRRTHHIRVVMARNQAPWNPVKDIAF